MSTVTSRPRKRTHACPSHLISAIDQPSVRTEHNTGLGDRRGFVFHIGTPVYPVSVHRRKLGAPKHRWATPGVKREIGVRRELARPSVSTAHRSPWAIVRHLRLWEGSLLPRFWTAQRWPGASTSVRRKQEAHHVRSPYSNALQEELPAGQVPNGHLRYPCQLARAFFPRSEQIGSMEAVSAGERVHSPALPTARPLDSQSSAANSSKCW